VTRLHFHSLRHTCASWLAEAVVDLRAIQAVMRHTDLRQTLRYASLHPDVAAARMAKAFAPMAEFSGGGDPLPAATSSISAAGDESIGPARKQRQYDRTHDPLNGRRTSRERQRRAGQYSLFEPEAAAASQSMDPAGR
jgi:hypothetical protein